MTMNTHPPLRTVMVGVGGFGGYRRERMRETGLFDLVAAYDYNADALARCASEDGAQPLDSFEALLDFPDAEAMVISTGAKFHAAQALAAMERGLHVFVEKPLCSTPDEIQALLAMQRRTGRVVGVGHNDHAHDNTTLHLQRLMAEGAFGTLATFEMVTAHSGGLEIKPGDWRGDPGKNPGGMLFQCGCHALHELMFLFGPIDAVSCLLRYDVHTTQTADVAHCLLHFQSGLIGTLGAYHVTPYRHTFNLYGTAMSLYLDSRAPAYGDASYIAVQRRGNCQAEPHEPFALDTGGDRCGNLRSFYSAVRDGGTPYPSLQDGARAVAVVFAAEESAKSGATVQVPTIE
jgi:predicted dehydrogenase